MVTYLSGGRIQGEKAHKVAYTGATDGSDTVLTFTESGTFTPAGSFDVEYLVVGGGGSGGFWLGGGGGAGAYRANGTKDHGVTAQTYTITVGAGGNGGLTQINAKNPDGDDSIFDTITSAGGGSGASHTSAVGNSAGSGGGMSDNGSAGTGGSYGNNGGTGTNNTDTTDTGGGGGGSAGVGGNGTNQGAAGAGGIGTANDISGSSLYYAAGGGGGSGTHGSNSGGSGGSSIGGDGGGNTEDEDGDDGVANRGSGGGGGAFGDFNSNGRAGYGGKGSAGIVIIRFLTSGNSFTATRGTVDEKIAITDVPAGTRYEETDTRKIYRRKAGVAVGLGTAGNSTAQANMARATNSAGANLGAYSADFNGSNASVTSGLTQNLGSQFSFSMWIQIGSLDAWGDIMGKGSADNSEEFVAYMHSAGQFYAISGEAMDDVNLQSNVRPRTQRWYHVVYTCDGTGEYKTYVNGDYVSKDIKTDVEAATSTTEALKIGTTRMSGFFDGRISQTLVYNDILTQDEVTALYNGGAGVATPNGNGLLLWYDFQEASGTILNKQSTSAVPDGDWVEKGTA